MDAFFKSYVRKNLEKYPAKHSSTIDGTHSSLTAFTLTFQSTRP